MVSKILGTWFRVFWGTWYMVSRYGGTWFRGYVVSHYPLITRFTMIAMPFLVVYAQLLIRIATALST